MVRSERGFYGAEHVHPRVRARRVEDPEIGAVPLPTPRERQAAPRFCREVLQQAPQIRLAGITSVVRVRATGETDNSAVKDQVLRAA